jgi:hypothetical protein
VPIVASLRINLKTSPTYSSYSEFMGLSASSTAATKWMFPLYNNQTAGGLETQLRFANVGTASTTVTVKVAGVTQATYSVAAGGSERVIYTDIGGGPVEVSSSGGVPIIASERVNLKTGTSYSSYSEFMGLPQVTPETRYLFPWYNNLSAGGVFSNIRFDNVGTASTTVTVKIAGTTQGTYTLAPNESRVVSYDIDNGPAEVYSSGGVPIVASMNVSLKPSTTYSSYSEFMGLSMGTGLGLPGNQLSATYWFPWYDNQDVSTDIRVARP